MHNCNRLYSFVKFGYFQASSKSDASINLQGSCYNIQNVKPKACDCNLEDEHVSCFTHAQ